VRDALIILAGLGLGIVIAWAIARRFFGILERLDEASGPPGEEARRHDRVQDYLPPWRKRR
jgi:hypothetical protein